MNFINPAAFWALFTVIIIVFLYFLKLKRKKRTISNLFLFNRMLVDQKANRPFQRLRQNLLLFIQILFLLLAVFGLARPTFIKDIFSNFNYIIIIDSSASMNAEDEDGNRFEIAKEKAVELINNFAETDMTMIITSDSKTRVCATLTSNKNYLTSTIKSLEPSETAANLYDAFIVVLSMLKQSRIDKIFVVSDGSNIGLDMLEEEYQISRKNFPEVEFISVGSGSDNVGIVDLDINSVSGENERFQVFARLVNFSAETKKTDVELYNSDNLIDVKEVEIHPGENHSVIFDGLRLKQGLITLKLSIEDALTADNAAYVYMQKPENISVLLVTDNNTFLENVLKVNPTVNFDRVAPQSYSDAAHNLKYDVVIFDSFFPERAPDANLLIINAESKELGIERGVSEDGSYLVEKVPKIIDYDKTHVVMKYINIDDTMISDASVFSTPTWLKKIVESENSTLIYAGEKSRRRIVLVAFDLSDSDFVLKSSFPIFIYNSMFWLSDHFDKRASSFYRTGDPVRLRIYDQETVEVTTPGMAVLKTRVYGDEFYFDDTRWVGLYTMKGKEGYEDFFIANLLDEKESNIAPSPFITVGGEKIEPSGKVMVRKELWKYFVMAALLFILLEWWIYHRKVF